MRITNEMMTRSSINDVGSALDRIYKLQQQVSSGKKYAYASENPSVASQGLTLRTTLTAIETYKSTQDSSNTWMEMTDLGLQQMVKSLGKVNTSLLDALNGLDDNTTAQERAVIAEEIDGLINSAMDIANSQDRGRYIFAGYQTSTKPFQFDYVTVEYPYIDNQTVWVPNASGGSTWTVPSTLSGGSISVTSASYITSGSDITGASITISGSPIYTRQVVRYMGDGNTISRDIGPNEPLSIAISGSQAFGDLTSACNTGGSAINISMMFDTLIHVRDLLRSEDYIQPNTSVDVILDPLTHLATTTPPTASSDPPTFPNDYTPEALRAGISSDYAKLQNYFNTVSEQLNINGSRMRSLMNATERASKASLEIKALISANEDVNEAEAYSSLTAQMTAYQAILQISGRTNSMMNLFDAIS